MAIIIGSAKHNENGKYAGGKAGDQTGGEVATQKIYSHSKGWCVLRLNSHSQRTAIANAMKHACENDNIGYSQNDRYGIITHGTDSSKKINCDCSSLVRQCFREATRILPPDFSTENEKSVLTNTGVCAYIGDYPNVSLQVGDILVTKSKGHTAIVVSIDSKTSKNGGFEMSNLSTIKNGCKGAQVKTLQCVLNGKFGQKLDIDGICGTETVKGIKAAQKKRKLDVDGICGTETWNAILTK